MDQMVEKPQQLKIKPVGISDGLSIFSPALLAVRRSNLLFCIKNAWERNHRFKRLICVFVFGIKALAETEDRMKQVMLGDDGYKVEKDLGPLNCDFVTESLMSQLHPHLEAMVRNDTDRWLVFTSLEESLVMHLLSTIAGGMARDRGMGRVDSGELLALDAILKPMNRSHDWIPEDLEGAHKKRISEIDSWSLTIH